LMHFGRYDQKLIEYNVNSQYNIGRILSFFQQKIKSPWASVYLLDEDCKQLSSTNVNEDDLPSKGDDMDFLSEDSNVINYAPGMPRKNLKEVEDLILNKHAITVSSSPRTLQFVSGLLRVCYQRLIELKIMEHEDLLLLSKDNDMELFHFLSAYLYVINYAPKKNLKDLKFMILNKRLIPIPSSPKTLQFTKRLLVHFGKCNKMLIELKMEHNVGQLRIHLFQQKNKPPWVSNLPVTVFTYLLDDECKQLSNANKNLQFAPILSSPRTLRFVQRHFGNCIQILFEIKMKYDVGQLDTNKIRSRKIKLPWASNLPMTVFTSYLLDEGNKQLSNADEYLPSKGDGMELSSADSHAINYAGMLGKNLIDIEDFILNKRFAPFPPRPELLQTDLNNNPNIHQPPTLEEYLFKDNKLYFLR
jgi:hypothetical protein